MKKILISFLVFNTLFLFAQKPVVTKDFTLSTGPKYKQIGNAAGEYHFNYGSQLLTLKKIKKAFVAQRQSLRNLTTLPSKTNIIDKGAFTGTIQLKDTVLIFYRQKNKLLTQKIQIANNTPPKSNTFLQTTEDIADDFGFSSRFGYDAGNRINAFAIKKSVDGSKFVVVSTNKSKVNEDDKTKNVINIYVYNSDMNLEWKKSLPLPYDYKRLSTDDFMVDSEGSFYILASIFDKERSSEGKRNKLESKFHSEIFKINKDDSDWDIKKIETSKSLEDAILYMDAFKKPVIVGFYSEKEIKGYVIGCFSAEINDTKSINPILHSIETDTIRSYERRKTSQIKQGLRYVDDKEDMEDLHINKITVNNDGSFNLFAEQRYTLRNSYYANGATTVNYEYYYKTAYACKIDGKGNLLWFNQLPKNQFGKRGKQTMSFQHLKFKNYHYILVWDKFSNLYKNVGEFAEILDLSRREYLFIATYKIDDLTGKVEKLPVVNSLEVDKYRLSKFQMGKACLINESDIVFEAYDGRGKNYLFRLQLN